MVLLYRIKRIYLLAWSYCCASGLISSLDYFIENYENIFVCEGVSTLRTLPA